MCSDRSRPHTFPAPYPHPPPPHCCSFEALTLESSIARAISELVLALAVGVRVCRTFQAIIRGVAADHWGILALVALPAGISARLFSILARGAICIYSPGTIKKATGSHA